MSILSLMLNYMVIIFSHEEEEYVSAAPKKWLCENETTMMWPRNKAIERKAIKLNMTPEEDWITYSIIRIVGYYATLQEAISFEKNKQNSSSSELEVLTREQGKRKIKKKYRDDSISPPPVIEIKEGEFPTASDIKDASITILDAYHLPHDEDQNSPDINHPRHSPDLIVVQSPIDAKIHESIKPIQSSLSDASIGAGSSSTSSMDTIMSELKEINKFVSYTVRKVEAIERSISRLNLPSETKPSLLPNFPLTELAQLKALYY